MLFFLHTSALSVVCYTVVGVSLLYCSVYLRADEVQATAVSTHVDVLVAGAFQAQLVGVAAGRTTVHLQPFIVSIGISKKGKRQVAVGRDERWAGEGGGNTLVGVRQTRGLKTKKTALVHMLLMAHVNYLIQYRPEDSA